MQSKKIKSFIVVFLCSVILLLPILSKNYIISHVQHRCVNHDCVICMELEIAAQAIQNVQSLSLVGTGILVLFGLFRLKQQIGQRIFREKKTLVALKVEMLN